MPPIDSIAPLSRASAPGGSTRRPEAAALQPNIGAMLQDVARLMRRRFDRRARHAGLPITRQQARALLYIGRNEGLSQAAVATALDIEPIALVRLLDRLHDEGLVERRPHATDRRVRTLWLSPRAWGVIERVLAINAEVREETCAGLAASAREDLKAALDEMKSYLLLAEATESPACE